MNLYFENECLNIKFDFDLKEVAWRVAEAVLLQENINYDCQISVIVTNNENIHDINRETREIDSPTDVLSFPNINYENPGDLSFLPKSNKEEEYYDYFDPDTNELILGEMIISAEKVLEQAESYGHSTYREFSFLVAHSMLHLLGYDHMEDDERILMEDLQKKVLDTLEIYR